MEGDCGPLEVIVGYNKSTKTKICKAYFSNIFNNTVCPANNVMIGINAVGNPVCRPMPVTTPTTPPIFCQVFPLDPSCNIISPGGGGSTPPVDGGCGGSSDGCS